jgi:SAM domain (Sterile alpha motif)
VDLAVWLRGLGLEQYEAAFRENAVTERLLPSLTAEDLKGIWAFQLLGIGVCCSTQLLTYPPARTPRRHPHQLLRQPQRQRGTQPQNAAK